MFTPTRPEIVDSEASVGMRNSAIWAFLGFISLFKKYQDNCSLSDCIIKILIIIKNQESIMLTHQEIRELFYPLEWILRLIIITLLCFVLLYLTEIPENYYMLIFLYRALTIGILIMFVIQGYCIWIFWRNERS